MDQLKEGLSKAAKHQFWIVTGIALLMGIVGFYMANSTLNDLFNKQKSALDVQFNNIQTVRSAVSTHPNAASQAQMQLIIDSMAEDVRAAWASQWSRQEPILKWPKDIPVPSLVRKLEAYQPVELKLEYPEEPANIVDGEKRAYATYFDEQMPRLAQIIGVNWVGEAQAAPTGGGMTGMGGYTMGGYGGEGEGGMMGSYGEGGMMGGYGMGPTTPKNRDLVVWPKSSQDELLTSIRMWRGDLPNVYQIMYTQENMWILEGLLNIIKKTNGNAQANFQAAIKEIEFIRIGRTAVGQAGDIDAAGGAGGMRGMMGSYGSGGYGGGSAMYGSEMETETDYGGESSGSSGGSEGGMGGTVSSADPADMRYVDAAFTPLSGEDLRSKMRSESPEDAYFAVAKRVPVRLRLKIDQRKTQEFLAKCGNADLMLEVRQVRLGDTTPASGAGGRGGSGGMGGMMGGGGRGLAMGDGAGGMGVGSPEGYGGGSYGSEGSGGMMGGMMGSALLTKDPWEIDIEVYGVVYLFNPVDIDRLGLNKVTEDTELDATVETTAPAVAEPPTDTTTPADGSQPAAVDPAQPPAAGAQPPAAGAQPPAAGAQPPAAGAQPPAAGAQPPAAGAQPPAAGAQLPANAGQPPAAASGQPDPAAAAAAQPAAGNAAAPNGNGPAVPNSN